MINSFKIYNAFIQESLNTALSNIGAINNSGNLNLQIAPNNKDIIIKSPNSTIPILNPVSGGGNWSGTVFSLQSYTEGFSLSCTATGFYTAFGVTNNPELIDNNIDYFLAGFYLDQGNELKILYNYQGGSYIFDTNCGGNNFFGFDGIYIDSATFEIIVQNNQYGFFMNGQQVFSLPLNSSGPFYFTQSFWSQNPLQSANSMVSNIIFQPLVQPVSSISLYNILSNSYPFSYPLAYINNNIITNQYLTDADNNTIFPTTEPSITLSHQSFPLGYCIFQVNFNYIYSNENYVGLQDVNYLSSYNWYGFGFSNGLVVAYFSNNGNPPIIIPVTPGTIYQVVMYSDSIQYIIDNVVVYTQAGVTYAVGEEVTFSSWLYNYNDSVLGIEFGPNLTLSTTTNSANITNVPGQPTTNFIDNNEIYIDNNTGVMYVNVIDNSIPGNGGGDYGAITMSLDITSADQFAVIPSIGASTGLFGLGTGDYTVEWWQYCTDYGSNSRLFSLGSWGNNPNGATWALSQEAASGNSFYYWENTGFTYLTLYSGNPLFSLYTWNYFSLVRKTVTGTTNIYLFMNGNLISTTPLPILTSISDSVNNFTIGNEYIDDAQFYGYITDFKVSSIALYTSSYSIPSTPLLNDMNTVLLLVANNTDINSPLHDSSIYNYNLISFGTPPVPVIWSPIINTSNQLASTVSSNDTALSTSYQMTALDTFLLCNSSCINVTLCDINTVNNGKQVIIVRPVTSPSGSINLYSFNSNQLIFEYNSPNPITVFIVTYSAVLTVYNSNWYVVNKL